MMRVLTDWYPGTVNPVREGLYLIERWHGDAGELFWWNCRDWIEVASREVCSELYRSRWRGLAFDPGAAVPWVYAGIYISKHGNKAWIVEVPR